MQNLHLLYNTLYYRDIGTEQFQQSICAYNKQIANTIFDSERDIVQNPAATSTFKMKTLYPGLLIGIGNPHQTNMSDDETKIGFAFDYTSGQPYIPGSTVKGILRSCFKQAPQAVLDELGKEWSEDDLPEIEEAIFDEGDVFFDAVICQGDSTGHIMGWDYLTPHGEDRFKAPVPLRMLKVLPDVQFEFRFILHNKELSVGKKQYLFKNLLATFGAGAKTNVGYGALEVIPEKKKDNPEKKEKSAAPANPAASGNPFAQLLGMFGDE